MMDEEIEMWYEHEKEKLSEQYRHSIEKGMKLADREKKFNRAMASLTNEYNSRYTRLQRKRKREKRMAELKGRFTGRILSASMAVWNVFAAFGNLIKRTCGTKYAHAHYKASMFRIHYGYIIVDGLSNTFRPLFYWYVRNLQRYVTWIKAPIIHSWRYVLKKAGSAKDKSFKIVLASWNSAKKAAKKTSSTAKASYKKVSGKYAEVSKKYHDWYSARLQKSLEKKQAMKEAREKKKKEKEAAKGKPEGQESEGKKQEAPEESPDAENTT